MKLELLKRQMWADRKTARNSPRLAEQRGGGIWSGCVCPTPTHVRTGEKSAGAPVGNYGLDPRAETRAPGSQACNGSQAIMRNTTAAILKKTLYPVQGGPDPHTNIQ